jgi:hypothetical protein
VFRRPTGIHPDANPGNSIIPVTCPGPEKLKAYLLGDLAEAELDEVAEHLDLCPDCAERADRLEAVSDTVLSALRRLPARGHGLPRDGIETEVVGSDPGAGSAGVPEQWGDFRIVREVGRGGMGVVCEAYQGSLNRHVALKFLPEHGDLSRFRREARAAARLHHTNIVPVFGIGEHEGRPYYVMQFIRGRGLDAVIEERKRLRVGGGEKAGEGATAKAPTDWRSVARIGMQVADALSYAHSQGVIHRDIKPSNLLIDDRGTVWVADFGLAKADDGPDLTRTGDLLGTVRYMPPEAFEGRAGARGDIYALGLTLFELLALRPAFEEKERGPLVRRITAGEVPRLEGLDPEVPCDLATIVHKAIEREPAHRYRSADELADDLRRFVEDRPIRARRISPAERTWRWCRRNKGLAASLGLAAGALVAAAVISLLYAGRQSRHAAELAEANRRIKAALAESNRRLAILDFERGRSAFEKGHVAEGMLWTIEALRMASDVGDTAWKRVALANLSAWRRQLAELKGIFSHDESVLAVAFSPDGRTILTGGRGGGRARLWDAATGLQ